MNKGQFKKGNRTAEKPKYCPYCGEEIEISTYAYVRPKKLNSPFKNGGKQEIEI